MSRYRIFEKKGTYEKCQSTIRGCPSCDENGNKYIPRYIVQENFTGEYRKYGYSEAWQDRKEFTDLDEARKFKNDLELEDGRVVE
jgi:hypothetical protein